MRIIRSGTSSTKGKTRATAPTEDELVKIINDYFYSKNYTIRDGRVYNTKLDKYLDDFVVEQKCGRWILKEITASAQTPVTCARHIYVDIPKLQEIDFHFKGKSTESGWARDTRKALTNYRNTGQMVDIILVDDNGVKVDGARKKFTMKPDGTITLKDSDGVEVEIGRWSENKADIEASADIDDSDGYGADESRDSKYLKKLADGVVKEYEDYFTINNLVYEISDAAITFIDGDVVLYIQPLSEIKPDMDDLDSDIELLADEVISAAIPKF